MGIPINELRKLKTQLDEGVITRGEFVKARDQILAGNEVVAPENDVKETTSELQTEKIVDQENALLNKEKDIHAETKLDSAEKQSESRSKKNLATIIVIICLICTTIGFAIAFFNSQEQVAQWEKTAKNNMDTAKSRLKYQNAVIGFYLDGAVIITEDDETYYHRHNCPHVLGKEFWILNDEAARGRGFKECPKCFADAPETFVEKYW